MKKLIEVTMFLLGLALGVIIGEIRMYFYMKKKMDAQEGSNCPNCRLLGMHNYRGKDKEVKQDSR